MGSNPMLGFRSRESLIQMPTQAQVVAYIRQLSDKDLAELFYEAIQDRSHSDQALEPARFVLAEAWRPEPGSEEWTVDLIAGSDGARYPEGWGSDALICQSGECATCGSR